MRVAQRACVLVCVTTYVCVCMHVWSDALLVVEKKHPSLFLGVRSLAGVGLTVAAFTVRFVCVLFSHILRAISLSNIRNLFFLLLIEDRTPFVC